jgi:hypothetical protein
MITNRASIFAGTALLCSGVSGGGLGRRKWRWHMREQPPRHHDSEVDDDATDARARRNGGGDSHLTVD